MSAQSGIVTAANPVAIVNNGYMFQAGVMIAAFPSASSSVLVEMSTTATAASNPGAANWVSWTLGTISSKANLPILGAVMSFRITLESGTSAAWEVCG